MSERIWKNSKTDKTFIKSAMPKALLFSLYLIFWICLCLIPACEKSGEVVLPEPSPKHAAVPETQTETKKKIRIVRLKPQDMPEQKAECKKKYPKAHPNQYKMIPCRGPGGRKWRIAYIEGGAYADYYQVLLHAAAGLRSLGWIDFEYLPAITDGKDTRTVWISFLSSARVQSGYIEFVRDAFYTADWDTRKRNIIKDQLIDRLNNVRDIDLVIAMGTWAGQDMANDRHSVPTVSMSVTDPVRAGIVQDPEDSGYDHLHSRTNPMRYRRQVELFYNTVGFRTLGIQYQDTPAGRSYSAVEDILDLAEEKGFDVVACELPVYMTNDNPYTREHAAECMEALSLHADAVYISNSVGFEMRNARNYLRPLAEKKIPAFAQAGYEIVRHGALIGTIQEWGELGRFQAEIIGQIFNGAKPRELPQIFAYKDRLAINLKTAGQIGFQPDNGVLSQTDMVFTAIKE
ncbi:MAG: ABC transporter substrate-binding protein [Desulfococcaceae bacterium]